MAFSPPPHRVKHSFQTFQRALPPSRERLEVKASDTSGSLLQTIQRGDNKCILLPCVRCRQAAFGKR